MGLVSIYDWETAVFFVPNVCTPDGGEIFPRMVHQLKIRCNALVCIRVQLPVAYVTYKIIIKIWFHRSLKITILRYRCFDDQEASPIPVYHVYRQVSDISRTPVGNKFVDHSDVVGASPVGAAELHLHSRPNTWLYWIGQKQLQDQARNN